MKNVVLCTFMMLFVLLGLSACDKIRLHVPMDDQRYNALADCPVNQETGVWDGDIVIVYKKGNAEIGRETIPNPYQGKPITPTREALEAEFTEKAKAFFAAHQAGTADTSATAPAQNAPGISNESAISHSTQAIQNVTEQIRVIQPTQVNPCFLGPPHC